MDASDYGWSEVVGSIRVQDSWVHWEFSNSINWREIKAIFNTVSFLQVWLSNRSIRIHTDSMEALFCLCRMGSLRSAELNKVSMDIIFIVPCIKYLICPCPHLRMSECSCRPGVKERSIFNGVVLRSRYLRLDFPSFSILPSSGPLFYEGQLSISSVCLSLPESEGFLPKLCWSFFQLESFPMCIHLSPPVLMPDILDRICAFWGTVVLIAPFVQSTPWTPFLVQRAHRWYPLPVSLFLFQVVNQQLIDYDDRFLKLYLGSSFPTSLRTCGGNGLEDGKYSHLEGIRISVPSGSSCSDFLVFTPSQVRIPTALNIVVKCHFTICYHI